MDLYEIKDDCRANLNKYLARAFSFIPKIEKAKLLDIGCGTGVSICEIARTTDWNITAADIDQDSLDVLKAKLKRCGYTDRISVVHGDVETAGFTEKGFDIILAEGLFNIIGFEKGLSLSSKYIKDNGYMVIHDELKDSDMKLKIFSQKGFKVLTSFALDEHVWWEEYCSCIEKKINAFRKNAPKDKNMQKKIKEILAEIEDCKNKPSLFRSMYYVIKQER